MPIRAVTNCQVDSERTKPAFSQLFANINNPNHFAFCVLGSSLKPKSSARSPPSLLKYIGADISPWKLWLMQAVKFVVKLYDVPPEDGAITAFDSYGNMLFVGTDKGIVHKLAVEDQHAAPHNNSSLDCDGSSIFTTLVRSEAVAEKEKKKISRLQHSRSQPLLFVLCAKKLIVMDSAKLVAIQQIAESVGAFFVSTSPVGSKTGHLVCAAEKYGRRMSIYHFDVAQGKNTRPILTQELQLPEPVQVLAEASGMLCVGLRREYSMLSLQDGDARGILALGNRDPLIAVGDGEVFLRLQQTVFSLPMKAMPTTGQALKRTMRFDVEPKCLAARHPFLFAFCDGHCDVFSQYDDEVVERLPLQGCLFSTVIGSGESLYAASKSRVWMIRMHGLRHQLSDLVSRYKVDDAFHLLAFHSRVSTSLQAIEVDLHIMTGFAHLYHCQPNSALQHINNHLDAREIISHVPELVPEKKIPLSEDDVAYWAGWKVSSPHNRHWKDIEVPWTETYKSFAVVPPSQLAAAVGSSGNGPPMSPAALALRRNKASSSLLPGKESVAGGQEYRFVTDDEGGASIPMTLATYLACCWDNFRNELTMFLRSKLAASSGHQRRAVEYALLQLYLRSGDRRAMFRLVRYGCALHLNDCEQLLRDACEFRVLEILLRRRGLGDEAAKLFATKLDVSSYLKAHKVGAKILNVPKSIEAKITAALDGQRVWSAGTTNSSNSQTANESPTSQPAMFTVDERDEAIFAVEALNVEYLHDLVRSNPNIVLATDDNGTSLIGLACSLVDETLMDRVLSMVSYLIDSGSPLSTANVQGWTPIDIIRIAHGGRFFVFVASVIVSVLDVQKTTATFVESSAACRSVIGAMPAIGVDGSRSMGSWCGSWKDC